MLRQIKCATFDDLWATALTTSGKEESERLRILVRLISSEGIQLSRIGFGFRVGKVLGPIEEIHRSTTNTAQDEGASRSPLIWRNWIKTSAAFSLDSQRISSSVSFVFFGVLHVLETGGLKVLQNRSGVMSLEWSRWRFSTEKLKSRHSLRKDRLARCTLV